MATVLEGRHDPVLVLGTDTGKATGPLTKDTEASSLIRDGRVGIEDIFLKYEGVGQLQLSCYLDRDQTLITRDYLTSTPLKQHTQTKPKTDLRSVRFDILIETAGGGVTHKSLHLETVRPCPI